MGSVAGGLGAAGGILSGIGGIGQQKDQNALYKKAAAMMNPQQVFNAGGQLNPYLFSALSGQMNPQYSNNGYAQALFNLAQNPGFIDPSMMNLPFHLSAQRGNQDLSRAQSLLGRTQGGQSVSGLGNAYALANQSARTARDVGTAQQFALFREQQRRSDLEFLQNALMQSLGIASGNQQGMANMFSQQTAPMNWMGALGGGISAGLGAAAPFFSPKPQQ